MSRHVVAFVFLTAIGLATRAHGQFAPTGAPAATPPFPAMTKTVLPVETRDSPAGNETFELEPSLSIDLDDVPAAPAGFDANTAYIALRSGRVVAVDLDQAILRWSHDLLTALPPVVNDGLVVVAGDELLSAFDAASGRPRWSVAVPGGFTSAPLIDSGWVVAAAVGGDVMAVRAADGQVLWRRALGVNVIARPFIAADAVYFSLDDGRLISLTLLAGEPRWERKLPGRPGEMLVLDDRLFVGCDDKYFYCLNPKNGKRRWRWRTGGKPAGPPAVDETRVYYVALDNILWALNRRDGTLKWRAELPLRPSGGPFVIGAVVAVAGVEAEVYGYRSQTGANLGKATLPADLVGTPQLLPGPHPLVSAIALVTREGTFVLLRRRLEPAPLPMPYPFGDEIPLAAVGAGPAER
jgi:outer membrane protein assembly factor BamB